MAHTKELDDMELLLKPCPFCGSKARVFKHHWCSMKVKKTVRGPFFYIGCSDPDCILYNDDRNARLLFRTVDAQFMIRRWNRRRDNDG